MKNFLFAFLMLSSMTIFSPKKESKKIELKQAIDNYLKLTIKTNEISGLAVGIVKNGKIKSI